MAIAVQKSSDVRFREVDLSQTLLQESAANAGIVFASAQGREGLFHCTTAAQFLDEYGNPDASISFGHYCALDYFREGNSLWAYRALSAEADYTYSAAVLKDVSGTTTLVGVGAGVTTPKSPDWDTLVGVDTGLALFYPKKGPGSYGDNLAVRIKSANLGTVSGFVGVQAASGGTLTAATYKYKISAMGDNGETLPAISADVAILSGSANKITLSWTALNGAKGYKIYGRTGGNFYLIATVGATATSYVDTGSVTPDSDFEPLSTYTPSLEFNVEVFDFNVNTSVPRETFLCTLTEVTSTDGVQQEITQRINPFSQYISVTSNAAALLSVPELSGWTNIIPLTGGDSGTAVTNNDIILGWDNFTDRDNVDVDLLINAGYTNVSVQQKMDDVATARGTSIALLDVPSTSQTDPQTMTDFRNLTLNMNSSYSALFGPDVLENDPYNGKTLYVPFSGWAAALSARTERVAQPWFSIAGLNRGVINVLGTRKKTNGQAYSEGERDQLFGAQVNYTRNFTGLGIALWEQMTLQAKASALSWFSVRRLVNVIKKSTYTFLLFSNHEPNDDFTRQTIVSSTSEYLELVKNARGISQYQVISNNSNNPPILYNAGILKVTIFITPIIPVHEIQVDMVITKQGVTFSEISIANIG